jgi:glycerophosphoryl diester phosphodiesterase
MMIHFAHRGIIDYENTIKGVLEVFDQEQSDMGVEIDVRFNTKREVVLCHDRENRNERENATLHQLLQSLDHEKYRDKHLMIDIKAFGIQSAKQLAHSTCKIIQCLPTLYEKMNLYLCSFNEYCVSELLFILDDMNMSNIRVGVITTGIPIGMYNHLEDIHFVSIEYGILCEEIMDEMKKNKLDVYSWVVNDASMKKLMKQYNVDGIIYDVNSINR